MVFSGDVRRGTFNGHIEKEYGNPYDENAVKVVGVTLDGVEHFIGYLPRNSYLKELMSEDRHNVLLGVEAYGELGRGLSDSYLVFYRG